MKQLLYYNLNDEFVNEQTNMGGDGTKVVSVVNGVAWVNNSLKAYYRYSKTHTTRNITVNYVAYDPILNKTFTIAPSTTVSAKVYNGKKTMVKVLAKTIENYISEEPYKMVEVGNSNTSVTFTYTEEKLPDGILRAYYVKQTSSTIIFCNNSSLASSSLYNYIDGMIVDGTVNVGHVTSNSYGFDGGYNSIHRVDFKLKTKDTYSGAKNSYLLAYGAFSACTSIVNCIIPGNITYFETDTVTFTPHTVPNTMFNGCEGLTGVTISPGTKTIGKSVFYGCSHLRELNLPEGLTDIGFYAFGGCSSLSNVELPESLETIGNSVFWSCSGIVSITIPSNVKTIAGNSFMSCTSLTSFTAPDSVETIGDYTFNNCTNLSEVIIGNGVKTIGYGCFYRCSSLTSLTIGSGLEQIEVNSLTPCFSACSSLQLIKISAAQAPIVKGSYGNFSAFSGIASNGTLIYPAGSDYSDWLRNDAGYLGYYGWTGEPTNILGSYVVSSSNEADEIVSEEQTNAPTNQTLTE